MAGPRIPKPESESNRGIRVAQLHAALVQVGLQRESRGPVCWQRELDRIMNQVHGEMSKVLVLTHRHGNVASAV